MLLKSWKLWAVVLLVASIGILAVHNRFLNTKLEVAEQKAALQEEVIQRKESEIRSLVTSIEKQNAAIEKLGEETANLNGALSSVASTNKQLIAKMNKRVSAIMNEVVPKDCSGALTNLYDFASESAKEWNR